MSNLGAVVNFHYELVSNHGCQRTLLNYIMLISYKHRCDS